jgi:hypothetical protein
VSIVVFALVLQQAGDDVSLGALGLFVLDGSDLSGPAELSLSRNWRDTLGDEGLLLRQWRNNVYLWSLCSIQISDRRGTSTLAAAKMRRGSGMGLRLGLGLQFLLLILTRVARVGTE